jgi:hypothetical protein
MMDNMKKELVWDCSDYCRIGSISIAETGPSFSFETKSVGRFLLLESRQKMD